MPKNFVPVQKPLKELTTGEIRQLLGGRPDSEVIRSILIAEVEAIRAGEPRERRTMRNLWYDTVKPVLSRAGILNNKTSGGKPVPWDRKLSEYLAELVRNGYTSYEELQIVDGSRQRQPATAFSTKLVDVQMVGAHFPWVILFTEKDTIWGELQSLASLYGVSAISGKGEPSNACTENTIRAIIRSEAFQVELPEAITILSLTDYDPAGYNIAQAQHDQALEAARGMPAIERGALQRVVHHRLGIRPDQLTAAERIANAYEPKDAGLEKWFAETGGVDGQPLGLELDALPLSQLRRMFAEGIEQYIDVERRRQDLRDAFIDLLACDLLMPDFEAQRQKMRDAIKGSDLAAAIAGADIPGDLFTQAALDGADWIGPVQTRKLFEGLRDQVEQAMKTALNGRW